jgi:hypothetical protein
MNRFQTCPISLWFGVLRHSDLRRETPGIAGWGIDLGVQKTSAGIIKSCRLARIDQVGKIVTIFVRIIVQRCRNSHSLSKTELNAGNPAKSFLLVLSAPSFLVPSFLIDIGLPLLAASRTGALSWDFFRPARSFVIPFATGAGFFFGEFATRFA